MYTQKRTKTRNKKETLRKCQVEWSNKKTTYNFLLRQLRSLFIIRIYIIHIYNLYTHPYHHKYTGKHQEDCNEGKIPRHY